MKSFFELKKIIKSIPFLTLPLHSNMTEKTSTKNKEERYSRVPRLSDTRYSKGNGDMQAAKRN